MKLLHWIARSLEEDAGNPSSIRLQMFIVCMVSAVLPLLIWAGLCIYNKQIVDIPSSVTTFCGLLFGGATAGKVFQYTKEP
jgi:hypothetical protein